MRNFIQECEIVQPAQIAAVGVYRFGCAHVAVDHQVIRSVTDPGAGRGKRPVNQAAELFGVGKYSLKQHFVSKIVGGFQILTEADKSGIQVRIILFRSIFDRNGITCIPSVGVAGNHGRQCFLGMLAGFQLSEHGEIQGKPVEILLRKPGSIQHNKRFTDIIHLGRCRQVTDTVFIGFIMDDIVADFLRKAPDIHCPQLRYHRIRVRRRGGSINDAFECLPGILQQHFRGAGFTLGHLIFLLTEQFLQNFTEKILRNDPAFQGGLNAFILIKHFQQLLIAGFRDDGAVCLFKILHAASGKCQLLFHDGPCVFIAVDDLKQFLIGQ